MTTIIDFLVQQLRASAQYNSAVQVAPAAILWTDVNSEWQSAMPFIKQQLPELIELGEYQPEQRIGPAIWVKCVIAGLLEECPIPADKTPIIYLPGVSRKDLRAIEQCPEFLQPLAELQYRGCWWAYNSAGRDWTVSSFLTNPTVGMQLDVGKDKKTQEAISQVLPDLLETPIANLKNKKLVAEEFYAIVLNDPAKDILGWLNNPEDKAQQWQGSKWDIFSQSCQSRFSFTPDASKEQQALQLLCEAEGEWQAIWARFADTATNLPLLVEKLKQLQPAAMAIVNPENYAFENQADEQQIESAFKAASGKTRAQLAPELQSLWQAQQTRKDWLWYRLGLSPWLEILEQCIEVLTHTEIAFSGPNPQAMAEHYTQRFWQADAAVLNSMAKARDIYQQELIAGILAIIYTPWLEQTTLNFQQLVASSGYPGEGQIKENAASYTASSQVVFFVDGLRYDTANMLQAKLAQFDIAVDLQSRWSALPSLTATAKAAVTPVADMLTGLANNEDFIPALADGHASFSAHYLQKLLHEKGWQYLEGLEAGDPKGFAWVQTGDLDNMGHEQQRKMPQFIDKILDDVVARIRSLFDEGWQRIRIVTDHGWLWVPDKLASASINKALVKKRLTRCAILKDNVQPQGLVVPWHWNPSVTVAMAPGIAGYVAGDYYNHGGLSLQECLTPEMNLTRKS